jgi:hypothetical protein
MTEITKNPEIWNSKYAFQIYLVTGWDISVTAVTGNPEAPPKKYVRKAKTLVNATL